MRIKAATAEDIRTVALAMRARDFEELTALSPVDTRKDLADLLVSRYAGRDDILCGSKARQPICIGGTIEGRPNVISLLFFATDDFPRIALPITRFIRNNLFPRYFEAGVHRIEAASMEGYDAAHHWLGTLGLTPETGPMAGFGKRGEAFIQFAKVLHADPAGA